MPINSKRKGKTSELEVSHILQRWGYDARRSQQYAGSNGDADVVGVPGLHIEVKHVEKLNLYKAIEQSVNDAKDGEIPVVVHRKNRTKWLITLDFETFLGILTGARAVKEDRDEVNRALDEAVEIIKKLKGGTK